MAKTEYYSRGKLLLTGEYAVLKGARAIALPTQKGQSLTVTTGRGSDIIWKSLDNKGNEWFSAKISLFDFEPLKTSDQDIADRLGQVLQAAVRLNSEFLSTWKGIKVETRLEFPKEWGLGTSSTFLCNVAAWADVDPFELQEKSFGGSGYDLACAMSDSPIIYQFDKEEGPKYSKVTLPDDILESMTFVYTGRKQNTEEALIYARSHEMPASAIKDINKISEDLLGNSSIGYWIDKMSKHNDIISKYLKVDTVEPSLKDFNGVVKPLGAWGGDFMLALSEEEPDYVRRYFSEKGYKEIYPANEILSNQVVAVKR